MTRSTLIATRRGLVRTVALAMVVAASVLGASGTAMAQAHHHKHGGRHNQAGGAPAGSSPVMVVTASPDPLVETGPSLVMTIVQVETSPSLAGDTVDVSSSQLAGSCELVYFVPFQGTNGENVILTLDNDGNATVIVVGENCAPGSSLITADVMVAPYYTASTTLQVEPPAVTPAGVTGYPNPEVEVGDTDTVGNNDIGNSDIFAVFSVETSPVYAEQSVEISSAQLEASCGEGWLWISPNNGGLSVTGIGVNTNPPAQALLDDDGNAVFGFFGKSCAAGTAQVIADVEAGTHPTYVTAYTVDPPAPTI